MKSNTDHDALFKNLSEIAADDLIALTFPEIYPWIDLSNPIRHKEDLNDVAHLDSKLYADTILVCPYKGHKDTDEGKVVIVHLEYQSYRQPEYKEKFAQRMFQYYCRIYGIFGDYMPEDGEYKEHRGKECIYVPLAILSDKCPQNTVTEYKVKQDEVEFFKVSEYNYRKKHLKTINWQDCLSKYKNNLAAIALLGKMKHKDEEKPEIKLASYKELYGDGLVLQSDEYGVLVAFIEEYLELSEDQQQEFNDLLTQLEEDDPMLGGKIMKQLEHFETKWHRQGKQSGIVQGKVEATKENIVMMVSARTGQNDTLIKSELSSELDAINPDNYLVAFRAFTNADTNTVEEAKDVLRDSLKLTI